MGRPVDWQKMSVPLGQGLETKASAKSLPPGKLTKAINVEFGELGALRKRSAIGSVLGSLGLNADRLAVLGEHLVGHAAGRLLDYTPKTNGFRDRGALRSIPTSSEMVKSAATSVVAADAFTVNGYRLIVWNDGTQIIARVVDEGTGATLSEQVMLGSGSYAFVDHTSLQALGTVAGGVTFLYAIFGASARLWTSDTGAWGGLETLVGVGAPGYVLDSRVCVDYADPNSPLLNAIFATQNGLWLGQFTPRLLQESMLSEYGGGQADGPVSIVASTGLLYVAYVRDSESRLRALTLDSDGNNFSDQILDLAPRRVVIGAAQNGNGVYFWDFGDGTEAKIRSCEISGSVVPPAVPVADWMLGASLTSAPIPSGDDLMLWVSYFSKVQSTTSTTGATVEALNSAALLAQYPSKTIVGRNLRGSALAWPLDIHSISRAGSLSAGGSGLVAATLATSKSDAITQALTIAGVAVLSADISDDSMRSAVCVGDLFAVGGSGSCFDGTNVVEQGFHVYPEIPIAVSPVDARAVVPHVTNSITALGAVINPSNVTGSNTNGHLYVAVQAGTTGGVAPITFNSALTVPDGGVIWRDIGIATPQAYQDGFGYLVGDVVYATSTGGAFVVTVPGTSGSEPSWPGSGSVSSGGVTFKFIEAGFPAISSPAGFGICAVYSWTDDAGQRQRSIPSLLSTFLAQNFSGGSLHTATYLVTNLRITSKAGVLIELYRTQGNGSTLQMIGLLQNDPTQNYQAFTDTVDDNTQASGVILYAGQDGAGELPDEPPPPCNIIATWNGRLVVNDMDDPQLVWPSKLIGAGRGAAWSSFIPIRTDARFGPPTAFSEMDDKLVIFHAQRIGIVSGSGPDNTGNGGWSEVEYLATDVGCVNPDSVVLTQLGIIFESSKGLFLLDRGNSTSYIGSPVENPSSSSTYSDTAAGLENVLGEGIGQGLPSFVTRVYAIGNITSARMAPNTTQVRFTTDTGNSLIYDYFAQQWFVATYGGLDAVVWKNAYVILQSDGTVAKESPGAYADANGNAVAIDVKVGDIRFDGVQGYARAREAALLFECSGSTAVVVQVHDDYSAVVAQENTGVPVVQNAQILLRFRKQKMQAISINIIEVPNQSAPVGLSWVGLDVRVGIKGGLNKIPAGKRVG